MSHHHDHGSSRNRLAAVLAITVVILAAEIVGAALTGSLALLADAGHMLTDTAGLAMALAAATLSTRPATDRRTWGWRRSEVLAAGAQAAVLLGVGVYTAIEGIKRLWEPPHVSSTGLLVFGVVGLLGNLVGVLILVGGQGTSLNMRAALLEVVNDAIGSVAVIVGAIVIRFTGWTPIDALAALLIAALIIPRAVAILREAGSILLESTPDGLDLADVRRHILQLPHVVDVHDLHASHITSGLPVLSAHVVLGDDCFVNGCIPRKLDELQACVAEHFNVSVEHSTFQFEPAVHADHEQGHLCY